MSVVLLTTAELVTLVTMLGALVWKRAQCNKSTAELRPVRARH